LLLVMLTLQLQVKVSHFSGYYVFYMLLWTFRFEVMVIIFL